ncbi:MAG: hypothetical protein J5768_06700, partial [Spirochaetales bacterium]|nr:hypothetical protein [Spirochaetales bacterium]
MKTPSAFICSNAPSAKSGKTPIRQKTQSKMPMTVSADLFLKDCPSLFPEIKHDFGQYNTVLHIMEMGLAFASRMKMETKLAPYGARLRKPETGLA